MSKPSAQARPSTIAVVGPVVVDADLAMAFLSACQQGDVDACHLSLLKLQQRYPHSIQSSDALTASTSSILRERRVHQPLFDLIGHGFATAATHGHAVLIEFMMSSQCATVLRDGICSDAKHFPPFDALRAHELMSCVDSIRFVCFAALACIDQLAMPAFQFLVETRALMDHEASLCLALAMRRAFAVAAVTSEAAPVGSVSPAAFHPMIVLLATHYDFLIDEIRNFHETFQSVKLRGHDWSMRLDRVKALQASLLYEIVLGL